MVTGGYGVVMGWLWGGNRWLRVVIGGYFWLWMVMGWKPVITSYGWLPVVTGGYGWLWVGNGWLGMVKNGYLWFWVVRDGYGVVR